MKIRKANYEDMSKISEFINSSASWYEPFVSKKDMKNHRVGKDWIDQNYKRREFYIGEDDNGKEVGTISLQYFGSKTYLGYIFLDSSVTGKGLGKKLIKFAEEKSKKCNQDTMFLIAHPEAKWATKAYERYGFEKMYEEKEEILNFEEGVMRPYYEEGFHLYEYRL